MQIYLEEALFDGRCPTSPFECNDGEVDHLPLQQQLLQTRSPTLPPGDKFERCSKVTDFFSLPLHRQAVELANALLRQFVFRVYKRRVPEIVPAFNNAFPRTTHTLTCKPLVRALLEEMGLIDEHSTTADDAEVEQSPLMHFQMRPQFSTESSATMEMENGDTLLEQLVRKALNQFHERHPGRYQLNSEDSSVDRSNSIIGNRTTMSRSYRGSRTIYERKNNMALPTSNSGLSSNSKVMSPHGSRETVTSALRSFFTEYRTEDEQVFIVAAALMCQHVTHPYLLPVSVPHAFEAVPGKDGNSTENALVMGVRNMISLDGSTHDANRDDAGKLSSELLALGDLLKGVQQDTVPWRALAALLGDTVSTVYAVAREQLLDSASSTVTSTQSSLTYNEASYHRNKFVMLTGGENRDVHESLGKERRRRLPSLLCLYLQFHLQRGASLEGGVNRRVSRIDREQIQLNTMSASMRESSSTHKLSPLLRSMAISGTTPVMHSLASSPSRIVSVQSIEKMTRIGKGSSGVLYAVPRLDTGELVAVKCIYITEHSRPHVENELSVLKRSIGIDNTNSSSNNNNNHHHLMDEKGNTTEKHAPNGAEGGESNNASEDARGVVRCYDMFAEGGCAYIVMELMDSGSLKDVMNRRPGCAFSEEECCAIAFQVLHGLRYLHDTVRQLHRDLKPHNILLNRAAGAAKLSDFGLSSHQLHSMGFYQCDTFVGTLAYMSPARVDADAAYGKESDFWSLGITLLEMALGKLPFTPTIFTIASFRTHPPRLPAALVNVTPRDNMSQGGDADDEHPVRNNTTVFSDAFRDFISALLPAERERDCTSPATLSDGEESLRSCACTYSEQRHGPTSYTGCDVDDDGVLPMTLNDGLVLPAVIKLPNWKPIDITSPMMHRDALQETPRSPRSPPEPHASCVRQHPPNETGGAAHWSGAAPTEEEKGEYEDDSVAEVTATALLLHPWLRGMTWEKSATVLSRISLEPPVPPARKTI
ncbi:protein kinase [Trypanosoma grayi]|uniref:protein kinase n=1 Tax=Trypanosoma grayi TaxID=71804 RepID=UPI0004F448F0|nr:protein kinase [Trypanosoma grayi]KEG09006.1 protein kinase [Trypanosoma grayi]